MRLWSIQDTQKESNCIVTCYHQSFSTVRHQCLENGKKHCVQCRKKIMQMPVEMPVEESISSTSEEEELKSNDTTSVVALGTGTLDELESSSDCWIDFIIMLCHCFSELWSFFPFSSETLYWHCRYTFVTHKWLSTLLLSLCVSLMDQNSIYSLFTSVTLHCAYSTE